MASRHLATILVLGLLTANVGCGDEVQGAHGEPEGRPYGGLWLEYEADARDGQPVDPEILKELANLPYTGNTRTVASDVTVHLDATRAWHGLNLVVSGHAPEAELIDMTGNRVHGWGCDPQAVNGGQPGLHGLLHDVLASRPCLAG